MTEQRARASEAFDMELYELPRLATALKFAIEGFNRHCRDNHPGEIEFEAIEHLAHLVAATADNMADLWPEIQPPQKR